MPRVTFHGPSRPITRTGVIGYDPDATTGEVPDPIDYADDAGWFMPYVSTGDVAFVQSKTNTNTTVDATIAATFDASPIQGNLLVAVITRREIYTDVSLTGWTRYPDADGLHVNDQPGSPNGSNGSVHLFYKVAGAGESSTVTISANGSALKALVISEFSGGTIFDTASNTGTGTTQDTNLTTGNLTPASSVAALLVGVILQSTIPTLTIGGSFTEIDQTICDTLGPAIIVGYRIVDPTSGSYAMTATSDVSDTYAGMLLSFLTDTTGVTWLPAFAVHDGSNTTFESVTETSIAGAADVFLRCVLTEDVILSSVVLRLGLEDAGSATITLEGATDEDFTTPVELDVVTQTATGSYTSDVWTFSPIAEGYVHLRFVLTTAQGARPFEVTLTGLPDPAATIADHLTDTTDAHDASAVSLLDTAGNTATTNVEDAIAELYGLTDIWRPVMAHDGTNWYVVVDGDGTAVMAQG